MYKPYTVVFFGHRRLENAKLVEQRLEELVFMLLRQHGEVDFLVGRNGEFDLLAASVVRRVRKEYGDRHSTLTLVLPYMTAEYRDNEAEFHRYYDAVEVFPCLPGMPQRACIPLRNHDMVDRADAVIACVDHPGGASEAVKYARARGRKVIIDCLWENSSSTTSF